MKTTQHTKAKTQLDSPRIQAPSPKRPQVMPASSWNRYIDSRLKQFCSR